MIDLPMMQQESSRTITRNDLMVSSSLGKHATHIRRLQLFLSSRHNRRLETGIVYGALLSLSSLPLLLTLVPSINFHYTIAGDDIQYLPLSRTTQQRATNVRILLLFPFDWFFSPPPLLSFQQARTVTTLSRRWKTSEWQKRRTQSM